MAKQNLYNCILYEVGDKVKERYGSEEVLEIESTNLKYVGIGNEDKMTPEFQERFKLIYKAVKEKHPEILNDKDVIKLDMSRILEKFFK